MMMQRDTDTGRPKFWADLPAGEGLDLADAGQLEALNRLGQALAHALRPVIMPADVRTELRRDLLRRAAAVPDSVGLRPALRRRALNLGRRSAALLGRPRARLALGAGTALAAATVGLALLHQRRQHRQVLGPLAGLG